MSNDLNSVLIEGKIASDPIKGTNSCMFFVHISKSGDELKEEITSTGVSCVGELADRCLSLKPGRQVRVIGRLAQDESNLFIQAEHVEFRPE